MGYSAPGGCRLIGREPELASLAVLANAAAAPAPERALVLTGGPGVGKTALWEAGLRLAEDAGFRVLVARPDEAEARHPFAGLFDLLDGVGADVTGQLPAPQRRALEAALLRTEPAGVAPEPFTLGAGLLGVLRVLATGEPLLLAIDDLQWLDQASAGALAFAVRRLHGHRCRFLITRRSGPQTELERALGQAATRLIDVAPLSRAGTYRLLSERFGLALPPRTLNRLFDATHGIPLLVLELGQTLAAQQQPTLAADLSVTEFSGNPFGARVADLTPAARQALLAASISGHLSLHALRDATDQAAAESLMAGGLLVTDGERVRPAHPLLAAAIRKHADPGDKRALHLLLARSAADDALRARHLALAASGQDADLASAIAAAAEGALRRGAAHDAVDLAEHALRLTPAADAGLQERILTLAEYLVLVGELARAKDLLVPRIADFDAGPPRARVHLLLAEAGGLTEHEAHLELALEQTRNEPELRALALAAKSILRCVIQLKRIDVAEECADQALALATSRGAPVPGQVLQALAWVRVMRGRPLDDLEALASAHETGPLYENSIDRQLGVRLLFRGQVAEARSAFRALAALADERGEARFRAAIQIQLCEVELRAGQVNDSARLTGEWHEWAALDDLDANWARCQALLAAISGDPRETERWAGLVDGLIAGADEDPGLLWDELEVRRARGMAALLTHQPDQAAELLGPVWEHARREGIRDPGAFPVAPDLVEALLGLGRTAEAAAVTERLRDLADARCHPWGIATADRCAAAVALAEGHDEAAAAGLAAAAVTLGELGLGFDRARALLWLGQHQRRTRKRAAARRHLESAAAGFDAIGSDGWAERARGELARVGGAGPHATVLTAAEQRVAVLAAEGLSNKEIARRLAIAVHTVEVHLAHAYAKFGVHSRTQLANRLTAEGQQ